MAAPNEILELVDRFERNKKSYLNSNYNETQLRQEFVNPFFEALGWDVNNVCGKAEAYKDVIHEDAIKIGKTTKAPDYSFRVGGARKFFLETKKPSVNIKHDTSPAYQIRRYSWSAKLPLAVLTDFEEFAVYDCRTKPLPTDSASVGRILYFRFDEYASRWDEIAGIFSKTAIEQGAFDKYAESMKGKRGTSEVDSEFLKEIEGWREALAKNIAIRNPGLTVREINFVVQRTVDRIIFFRICEDRGIEPYGQLQNLIAKENIYGKLIEIYESADEKYNSGLFHFKDEKCRASIPDYLSPAIKIDDTTLKAIFKNIYYPECPYEFSVFSADILGNVYEQFLGKVIRLTAGHRAVVEEKPEVKKAGGVYYTPKYIVEYIVENTVGKLIKGKAPKQISDIKILDPACGSGSFLIGAYSYLLDYHRDWYVANKPEKHKSEIYEGRGGQWYLTTEEKKRILLNNIHGVDIDDQAVEVSKLNLLLKVLENENQDTLLFQKKLVRERALPDLGQNIKCGNSLIGPDFYAGQKTLLGAEEQYRINAFDWKTEFPDIMGAGGFDCVIGNPPYIRIQAMKEWAPQEVEFYKNYASASKGNYDIYVVFVEKGLSLLDDSGVLGFILPHKFFQSKYGEPLRKIIADGRYLDEVVHFGDQQVFKKATTYTCLLFLNKGNSNRKFRFMKVDALEKWQLTHKAEDGKIDLKDVTDKEWNFNIGEGSALFEKLGKMPVKLGDVTRIFQGLVTGADKAFILDSPKNIEPAVLRPFLKSDLIEPYGHPETRLWMLFPYYLENEKAILIPQADFENKYPNAWKHLKSYEKILQERERGKWNHEQWYAFGRSQNLTQMEDPKLIIQVLSLSPRWIYDDRHLYMTGGGGGPFYGLKPKTDDIHILYLMGILNSKLFGFIVANQSTKMRGGYIRFSKQYIESAPICTIDFSNPNDKARHDKMVSLVGQMLDLHKRLGEVKTPDEKVRIQRQIEATDGEIDKVVYGLYGLTEDEIKVVEGE